MPLPNLLPVKKFESRGSAVHSHYDGREIQRVFYLRPYSAAPAVTEALLGSVTRETASADWVRQLPAKDPSFPDCYCNEVRCRQVHPLAIASSDTLALKQLNTLLHPNLAYREFMEQVNKVPDTPAGGCFLTASYRPLLTAYRPYFAAIDADRIFDWIDPQYVPSNRTVPWPDGLQIAFPASLALPFGLTVPDEVANPISVPVIEFTIKRLLVGEVPWKTINALANTVNDAEWPTAANRVPDIPRFPKGCLRFESCKVIPHYSRESTHVRWYELVYHFSWLSLRSVGVWGDDGNPTGDENGVADVTWNHTLMRPSVDAKVTEISYGSLGWYFTVRRLKTNWSLMPGMPRLALQIGPLYSFAKFDELFNLQAA